MELGRPWYVLLVVALMASGVVAFGYFTWQRRSSRTSRAVLTLLRVAAITLLALCLLEPTRVSTRTEVVRSQVAVLLDRSQSMTLADASPDGETRWEIARAVAASLSTRLAERFDVRFYTFDAELNPASGDGSFAPDGRSTDVYRAVRGALDAARGTPVAGVFVLSDGAQNVGNVSDSDTYEAPVFALGVGSPTSPNDLAVTAVNAEPALFVGQRATVEATLRAEGYPNRLLAVTLAEENVPVALRTATVPPSASTLDVAFDFTPKREGTFRYTVSVSSLLDEFTAENNARSFTAQVLPSRTRVLLVDGTPRYEFAFLRRTLERVPTMALTTVLLASPLVARMGETIPSRTGFFPLGGASGAFPSRDVLFRHDVVLVGDVALSQLTESQRSALTEFEERRGGGVAWLAGERWLSRRNGADSLEPLLPVIVPADGARIQPGEFAPELAAEGRYHPTTQLAATPEENDLLWRRMPLWSRLYGGLRPKPGSTVLITANNGASPVIAFQRVGSGKSLLVATDALWGWAFASKLDSASSDESDAYDRFWTQTVRWLATRSDVKQVNLSLGKAQYETGEVADVGIRVFDAGFVPVSDAAVLLTATDPNGNRSEVPVAAVGGTPGRYQARLRLTDKGIYELRAEATSRGVRLGADTLRFTVETPRLEFERPARNDALLSGLAERSGGRFLPANEADKVLPLLEESDQTRTIRVRHAVWDNPFVLLAVLVLLGVEWAWRKKAGLL
jgi:hypothetical protein